MIDKVPCFDGADVLVGGGWLVGLCCFVWSDGVGRGCRSHLVEGQKGTGKGPEGGGDKRGCLPNRLYLIFCRRNTTFDRNLLRTHAGGVNSIRAGFRMVWAPHGPAAPLHLPPSRAPSPACVCKDDGRRPSSFKPQASNKRPRNHITIYE